MVTANGPALQVVGLAKRFRQANGDHQVVLDSVDLLLRPGSFTLVTGAPCSGRSTLLRCLYRTLQPDRGRAYLFTGMGSMDLAGAEASAVSWARRHYVRLAGPDLVAPDRATSAAVLSRVLQRSGLATTAADRRASTALRRFGVPAERPLRHLDAAARATVAFLSATLPPATLVLLDEPFSRPDEETAEQFLRSTAETCQRGTAILATAPIGSAYEGFADRVVLLQQGRAL